MDNYLFMFIVERPLLYPYGASLSDRDLIVDNKFVDLDDGSSERYLLQDGFNLHCQRRKALYVSS